MRHVVLMHLLSSAFLLAAVPTVVAQEKSAPTVFAIDQPTADLWNLHRPESTVEVVVRSEDETYDTINKRALLLRDAKHVLFRGDQSSLVSQFFRERISNQGVKCIDLVQQFRFRERVRRNILDARPQRVVLEQSDEIATVEAAMPRRPGERNAQARLHMVSSDH